jgi:DNA-binding MarR family transcriptional regulator
LALATSRRASASKTKTSGEAPAILDRGELNNTLGFVLRRAWVSMDQVFTQHLGAAGITSQLYAMLIIIEKNPGCRISELCRAIGVSPTNIVPAIDVLLARGLVCRDFSSHDRRAKRLSLTEVGASTLAELRRMHRPVTEHFTTKLGARNLAKLTELLGLMAEP